MIGGKKFKTLREARKYLEKQSNQGLGVYGVIGGRVYKYFVGTHIQWLNL